MGNCFLYGNGGSNPLNFKVVGGTTAPENPKENTIWINTDTEISNWIFDTSQPDTTVEGTVWIKTGTASDVKFNALKKNSIQIFPLEAHQYISGAWVRKNASIYKNGAYLPWWDGYIYKEGDQRTDITGGWTTSDYVFWTFGCNASFKSNYMTVSLVSGQKSGGVGTANKIDLSGYTKLKAKVKPTEEDLYVCVLNSKGTDMHGSVPARTIASGNSVQTVTVDISKMSSGYIGFGTSGTASIYSVWLE